MMDEKEYFLENTDILESDLNDKKEDFLEESIEQNSTEDIKLDLEKYDINKDSSNCYEKENKTKDESSLNLAIISFVFSIISIIMGGFFSIISIIMAIVSKTINKLNDKRTNTYANTALIISVCSILLRTIFIVLYFLLLFSLFSFK